MLSYEAIQAKLRSRGVTLRTLQSLDVMFTRRGLEFDYDMELDDDSDTPYKRLEDLMNLLEDLDIDLKYLNQYPEVFTLLFSGTEEEFEQMLNEIRRKGKRRRIETTINMLLVFPDAMRNDKIDEMNRIIEFLEQEGIDDIINNSNSSDELLSDTSYEKVVQNYRILSSQVKGYKSIIREKPQVLFRCTPKELDEIIKNINESKEKQAEEEIKIQNNKESNNDSSNTNLEYIGEEDEIKKIYDVFAKYHISVSVLLSCPDILRYRKPSDIVDIIELLYKNGVPMYIFESDPELLRYGKIKQIEFGIKELKNQGFSLDFLASCPRILYMKEKKMMPDECIADKIKNTTKLFEDANINKKVIYSCPELLILDKEINTKVFVENCGDMIQNIPDINIILEVAPYVYIPEINNLIVPKEDMDISKLKSKNIEIVVIKDLEKDQAIISYLKEKDIDTDCIKQSPEILNKADKENVENVLNEIERKKYDMSLIESNVSILYLTVAQINEMESELKGEMPDTYQGIIQNNPRILTNSNTEKIKSVIKGLREVDLPLDIINQKSDVLTINEPEQIKKIVLKLREHNITDEQIIQNLDILSKGNEKYIDRNFEMFERYKLQIPFGAIYAKSARNNEKIIDTLIENNLYQYIEVTPEILDVEHAKVLHYLILAEKEQIPIVVRDENKNKVLNMQYFNMTPEQVSEEYGIELKYVKQIRKEIDRKSLRRVLNTELYEAVYGDFAKTADETLSECRSKDVEVAYERNGKKVSREKVIRETYLDLERKYARIYKRTRIDVIEETGDEKLAVKKAKQEAKKVIREFSIKQQLDRKIDTLTSNNAETKRTIELDINVSPEKGKNEKTRENKGGE